MNDLFPQISEATESHPASQHIHSLIQSVSHELRGTFGVISGLHSLLPMVSDGERREDMFNRLHNNTDYAAQLFADLEEYCALEADGVRVYACEFRPASILESVRKKALPMLKRRNATIHLEGDRSILVTGDEEKVGRITKNLIFHLICVMRVQQIRMTWKKRVSSWALDIAYSGDTLPAWLFRSDHEPFIPETGRLISLLLVRRLVSILGGAIYGGLADADNQSWISLQFAH